MGRISAVSLLLWAGIALLVSLVSIGDQDLGFHIAWGRILLHDFRGAGSLLLGQDPSVTVYAYSYWLYQVIVATLGDHVGPWGLVLFRAFLVMGALAVAALLARRTGASIWAIAATLAVAILMAFERFVDRPDVFSSLAWIVALWVLVAHRQDRGVWVLLPLQILWVNMHHHYSLLPPLYLAFVVGDAIEGKRDLRRSGLILGALILASFLNPVGPGAWRSQLKLAGVFTGKVSPIPLQELISPYSPYHPFAALWVFRIMLPVCLAVVVAGRKRLGTGALLALLIPTVLAIVARRAMSLFAVTALAFVPVALDEVASKLPSRGRRSFVFGSGLVVGVLGLIGVVGLANGRILLAQDKSLHLGAGREVRFPATGAARFLQSARIEGPIFHNPTSAGAILMENGTRLTPFLDPRWCGTADANRVYTQLEFASDEGVPQVWDEIQRSHGFEAVLLDFYEMPALLRHLASSPGWAMVHLDDGAAVFCRREGRNDRAIRQFEPEIIAGRAGPDAARESALGQQVVRFLRSPKPSILARLTFPWPSFQLANFAMQIRSPFDAQRAYLALFEQEHGALHVSRHRVDILGNVLWCLAASSQWEARAALSASLAECDQVEAARRRGLRLEELQALIQLERYPEAETVAGIVVADPQAGPDEIWSAWALVGAGRTARGDQLGAIEALKAASRARPGAPDPYRAIGTILDTKLGRYAEALQAYERFCSLGGQDPAVDARMRQLRGTPSN